MYIMLTSRCNMRCAHCCQSCGPNTGSHMSKETLKKALDLAAEHGQSIFIGGGEPTVHPLFWEMMGIILSYSAKIEIEMLGMVTNGKKTEDALALAALARRGIVQVELSQDYYHEPIDPKVVKAFTVVGERREGDLRGIRTVNKILAVGRGKNISGASNECACDEMMIDPKGKIWACACKPESFGTVEEPNIPQEYWEEPTGCWKKRQKSLKRKLGGYVYADKEEITEIKEVLVEA